jgi:hypothetical protein
MILAIVDIYGYDLGLKKGRGSFLNISNQWEASASGTGKPANTADQ